VRIVGAFADFASPRSVQEEHGNDPVHRPFVLPRTIYSGGRRNAATLTGDKAQKLDPSNPGFIAHFEAVQRLAANPRNVFLTDWRFLIDMQIYGEKLFSKLKTLLRKAAKRSTEDLWKEIGELLNTVSTSECAK
jgi:hypothetical protein